MVSAPTECGDTSPAAGALGRSWDWAGGERGHDQDSTEVPPQREAPGTPISLAGPGRAAEQVTLRTGAHCCVREMPDQFSKKLRVRIGVQGMPAHLVGMPGSSPSYSASHPAACKVTGAGHPPGRPRGNLAKLLLGAGRAGGGRRRQKGKQQRAGWEKPPGMQAASGKLPARRSARCPPGQDSASRAVAMKAPPPTWAYSSHIQRLAQGKALGLQTGQ